MGWREDGFESVFPSESGPPWNGLKIEAPNYALCWLLFGMVVQEQVLTPESQHQHAGETLPSTFPPTLACPAPPQSLRQSPHRPLLQGL